MKISRFKLILPALIAWAGFGVSYADGVHQMNVDVKKKGAEISNTMYGLFFEDINFAADGGLYAELLENRSFEAISAIFFIYSFVSKNGTFSTNISISSENIVGFSTHFLTLP